MRIRTVKHVDERQTSQLNNRNINNPRGDKTCSPAIRRGGLLYNFTLKKKIFVQSVLKLLQSII